MDPSRLLRFHRARVRARYASVLRPGAPVGQCGTCRESAGGIGQSTVVGPQSTVSQPVVSGGLLTVDRRPSTGRRLAAITAGLWSRFRLATDDTRLSTDDCRLSTATVLDALLAVALSPTCAACQALLEQPTDGP